MSTLNHLQWWVLLMLKMSKEQVNHPDHYGGIDNVYEVINVIEAYNLNFSLGNTIKYTLRAGKKLNRVEDLEKAKWYLEREINRIKSMS
jgi:hypothetical protein